MHRRSLTHQRDCLHFGSWLFLRDRETRVQFKKWSFLSYHTSKNLIFHEHVHNHASVVCTKLRRWVERITIVGLQRNVVTCSEFTQWVRRLGLFVAPLAASHPHAHFSSRVPPPWGALPPLLLSWVSFLGLPCLSEVESAFLPSSPPAFSTSPPNPCPHWDSCWETWWIKNATWESALFFKPEMHFICSVSY